MTRVPSDHSPRARGSYLNPLDLEQLDIRVIPYRWLDVSQVYHAPHVRAEPRSRAGISLIPPDKNRMWHRQQADQSTVLQEFQDLALVRQSPVALIRRIKVS